MKYFPQNIIFMASLHAFKFVSIIFVPHFEIMIYPEFF